MTTIATPVRFGPRPSSVGLLMLLAALVVAGIGLLVWSVIDSRGVEPATADPASVNLVESGSGDVDGSARPRALSRGTASVVESGSRGTAGVVESGSGGVDGSARPRALSRGTAGVAYQ